MSGGPGKVYLVGAGPGHEKLITVRGLELIREADCIVYDRLAGPDLLKEARPRAERIYCGKSPHGHVMKQDEINALLVEKAGSGKRVVRLKGGDPFIFGRGGEEAAYCRKHGVPIEVVPGVTAAAAAAAWAGIPLTDRTAGAASVALNTGHRQCGEPAVDPDRLKSQATADTLVIYMGMKNLALICDLLMEGGRQADTPTAIIENCTMPGQRTLVTTLGHAAEDAPLGGFKAPSLVVIGRVVDLLEQIHWSGATVLYSRDVRADEPVYRIG
ncbi:Uroporphyrin-III C-methyltransferase [Thermobacillus xylanilyticus]|uniref:uroporphyrinogen-III C-methyltransferase n=1 Tax=Thermobacillus xylanilyticus TaxID=76633 RepID=A0ABM8V0B3_THEXY|nr:uroporphyrinogen-III C-methyltransferase [Thermobacillus xylanilyticus]CAG5077105.1 Uroporphyrin-III C-methyltransferase [Thermobacillus xylanilyticus]